MRICSDEWPWRSTLGLCPLSLRVPSWKTFPNSGNGHQSIHRKSSAPCNPKSASVRSVSHAVRTLEISLRGIQAIFWEGLISVWTGKPWWLYNLQFSGSKPSPGMGRPWQGDIHRVKAYHASGHTPPKQSSGPPATWISASATRQHPRLPALPTAGLCCSRWKNARAFEGMVTRDRALHSWRKSAGTQRVTDDLLDSMKFSCVVWWLLHGSLLVFENPIPSFKEQSRGQDGVLTTTLLCQHHMESWDHTYHFEKTREAQSRVRVWPQAFNLVSGPSSQRPGEFKRV